MVLRKGQCNSLTMFPARYIVFLLCIIRLDARSDVELLGGGASFPSVVYARWMSAYRQYRLKTSNVIVNLQYDQVGSGTGKARIKGDALPKLHYAGSDIPLTEEESNRHPDLAAFPVIAGSIVIAYNIPEINGLVLNLQVAVGIYTGTIRYWNNTLIQTLNPNQELPFARIVVLARADKSGTTTVFTSGLSSCSVEWQNTYGTFSEGYDRTTRRPLKWNESVVSFYGHANTGTAALISALYYSIGYVSISTAISTNLRYAVLQNDLNDLVNASSETVQNAIRHANGSFDIINVAAPFAYPLSMISYFILPMSSMTDCVVAIELVRYINWVLNAEQAIEEAEDVYLVPLDNHTVLNIVTNILQKITCKDRNVWQLMEEQIAREGQINVQNSSWQMTLAISISVMVGITLLLCLAFGRQQYKVHRELIRDTWNIPANLVEFRKLEHSEEVRFSNTLNPQQPSGQSSSVHMLFGEQAWMDDRIMSGKYNDNLLTFCKLPKKKLNFTLKKRKYILWLRDSIKHVHVMSLEGLTEICKRWYTAHSCSIRGSLKDVLLDGKFDFQTSSRVTLVKSISSGLAYLHKKNIIHGTLTSKCCYIDCNWNIKIASWFEHRLTTESNSIFVNDRIESLSYEFDDSIAVTLYWTAPEIIKYNRQPTYASDIYSMSMVFQEIFTSNSPYSELNIKPSAIINAVIICGITPRISAGTPMVIRNLMEKAWEFDPGERPTASTVEINLNKAFPTAVSFIDCMTSTIEQYAATLESKVKEHDFVTKTLQDQANNYLYQNIPKVLADRLVEGRRVETTMTVDICIVACTIANTQTIIRHVTPSGYINLLNHFYVGLEKILWQDELHKLSRGAEEFVYAIGTLGHMRAPINEGGRVSSAAKIAAKIMSFADKFSAERLVGIDTTFKLSMGLSKGTMLAGVLKLGVPEFVILGKAVEDAKKLCKQAASGSVRVTMGVYSFLKDANELRAVETSYDNYVLDISKKPENQ